MQRENEKIAKFYKSQKWQKCRNSYIISKNYICERCGKEAFFVHHKIYINEKNINDSNITLNFDNLECLCKTCHNQEHFLKNKIKFDKNGDLIAYS